MTGPPAVALPLLSPRGAALRRVADLRRQRDRFADRCAEAEGALAAAKAGAAWWEMGRTDSAAVNRAEEEAAAARQMARNAARVLAAAEESFALAYGEAAPADIEGCAEAVEPMPGLVADRDRGALDRLRRRRERDRAYQAAYSARRKAATMRPEAAATVAEGAT